MPHRAEKLDPPALSEASMLRPHLLRLAVLAAAVLTACKTTPPAIATDDEEELKVNPRASSGSCGKERWSVKTGTDADASKVVLTPIDGTVSALTACTAPATPP